MPDRILELEREIERLRGLLLDYDIDPDPALPQVGPPTAAIASIGALVNATFAVHAQKVAASMVKNNPLLRRLSRKEYDRAMSRDA